ncbi:MAG: glycosyltransferase [Desulfomicrobium sp.]|nr:glycosyltransferase [Pseudomonadota bacterium]MBU4572434.1 glycosyltransferase [Pseudomonadota bacterium]MBV1713899.1 glycosyltransferase [Desulfomicrobium sp.]MBV1719581.1 glycosyltransferase [Desulfomicrobium sp.]MBV1748316.1 glycosyltransferase [Desulfomicrobium sp.]
MRLLYLIAETWPTHRADVAALFGKYLPRHGIQSDLVTGRTSGHEGPIEWGGGEAILCNISGGQTKKHIKTLLHGIRQLFVADCKRYDAIQVRDMPFLGLLGLIAARLKGLPFIYWMSYPISEGQIAYAWERGLSQGMMKFFFPWVRGHVGRVLLYRVVLPSAEHIFVQSAHMKQRMVERGIPADRMTPVPMGVDLEAMQPVKVDPVFDPRLKGRRALVYLGTMISTRRIEILFDMLARVREEVPSALLVLVGDAEDVRHKRWLLQQAESAGVAEHVIWTGWLPMSEGWRYVRAAEVGLSPVPRGPLLDVGTPTKVSEYLALGVPVVCSDNPDQQYLVSVSESGKCVPYRAELFASAVLQILFLDKESKILMAERGAETVRVQRDYSVIAAAVSSVYFKEL